MSITTEHCDECTVGNLICQIYPVPCSENCACYVKEMVTDLKKNIAERYEALATIACGPPLRLKLTDSEIRILPSDAPCSSEKDFSLLGNIAARELTSRLRETDEVIECKKRFDKFNSNHEELCSRLNEAKAALKSIEELIKSQGADEGVDKSKNFIKRSKERRKKMREIFELANDLRPVETCCDIIEQRNICCPPKERELDRATLKLALGALAQLLFDNKENVISSKRQRRRQQQQRHGRTKRCNSKDVSKSTNFDDDEDDEDSECHC